MHFLSTSNIEFKILNVQLLYLYFVFSFFFPDVLIFDLQLETNQSYVPAHGDATTKEFGELAQHIQDYVSCLSGAASSKAG